ncbi:MAG TPA: GNAT family N-acetyltransferase [Acidimicrobiales bacterium]|nr:GNAT family N-acetyltransferase [Acidimicrobiales bacterium]
MEIRAVTRAELADVLSFWATATEVASATDDLPALLALVEHDPDSLLVAVHDGVVVGTLIAAWDGWRGSYYRLAVAPSHRRTGLGRALVMRGQHRLEQLGARRIGLFAVGSHEPAMRFWAAVGFTHESGHERFARTRLPADRRGGGTAPD